MQGHEDGNNMEVNGIKNYIISEEKRRVNTISKVLRAYFLFIANHCGIIRLLIQVPLILHFNGDTLKKKQLRVLVPFKETEPTTIIAIKI